MEGPGSAWQVLEGQICIQGGNSRSPEEERRSRGWSSPHHEMSDPEVPRALGERDHPTQVLFHNHGEVFTWDSLPGQSRWVSPRPAPAAAPRGKSESLPLSSRALLTGHVTSYRQRVTCSDSQLVPAGRAKRWATKVGEGRCSHRLLRGSASHWLARGCRGGQHGQRRIRWAWRQATGSSLLGCWQPNRPCLHQTPRELSAERGRHTERPGGCWHPSC